MRTYSFLERIFFGVGLLFLAATSVAIVGIMMTQSGAVRDPLLWIGGAGAISGCYVCLRIIITGRATPYLEQDVRDAFGFGRKGRSDDRAV